MKKTLLVLSILSTCVAAQPLKKWGYPDPDDFAKAVLTLCGEQRDSMILATRYRDAGRTKEEVLALIPPNSTVLSLRVVDVYRENIEDAYAYPQYGTYSMLAFRAEVCRREVLSARRIDRFGSVQDKVGACELRHGKSQSSELYSCIRDVVDGMQ